MRWIAGIIVFGIASLASATTFTVNSTADDGSSGTLRWAVEQANANPPGPHIIEIALANGAVIILHSNLPPVASVTIRNANSSTAIHVAIEAHYGGERKIRISGNNNLVRQLRLVGISLVFENGANNIAEFCEIWDVSGYGVLFDGGAGHRASNLSFKNANPAIATEQNAAVDVRNNSYLNVGNPIENIGWMGPSPPDFLSSTCSGNTYQAQCQINGPPNHTFMAQAYNWYSNLDGVIGLPATPSLLPVTTDSNGSATFSVNVNHSWDLTKVTVQIFSAQTGTTEHTELQNVCKYSSTDARTVANTPLSAEAGDPVNAASGELYDLLPPDFNLSGPMPLFFQRYYASRLMLDGRITGRLGHNWLHNFEWKLTHTIDPPGVEVVDWQGRVITFAQDAGQWVLTGRRRDVPFQLVQTDTEFVFGDPRTHRLYLFNLNGRLTSIEDGRGNTHTLTYNGDDLASVSDGLGRMLTFDHFNGHLQAVHETPRAVGFVQSAGDLTDAYDSAGRETKYIHGAGAGLITRTVRPENNAPFEQTFDSQGRVSSQTEAGGHVTTFVYSNSVADVFNPAGNRTRYLHNGFGNLTSFTDEALASAVSVANNTNQQRTAITDFRLFPNLTIQIGYDTPSGRPNVVTNADGTTLRFTYTNHTIRGITFHTVAGITHPDSSSESFTYDGLGNVIGHVDRAGGQWMFGYNERGQILAVTNSAGGVATFTYDPNGTLASRTDSDTGVTLFEYDSQRRLSKLTHPDGAEELFTYDINDRLLSVRDGRRNLTRFNYDRNGNLLRAIDANNQTNGFEYDGRDRAVRAVDRLGNATGRSFNSRGLISAITNRNGNVTTFTHDTRRRLASITEPGAFSSWSIGYANDGIANSFTNPLNQVTRMTLNARRYEIGRTNPLGHVTTFGRDAMMRVTSVTDAIGRSRQFSYDGAGRLTSASQPGGPTASYTRNSLGLLNSISDLKGSQWAFAYTPMGRPASATDPLNRTTQFAQDSRGRIERITFADGSSVTNTFDPAGNLARRRYSGGLELQYGYDALNRLASAHGIGLAYDAQGRVTHTTNTSGANIIFGAAYDAGGRLTNVTYNAGAFIVTYIYDARDRLVGVSDTLTGTQLTLIYDNANRLVEIQRPNFIWTFYTHDAAGRLTRIQDGGIIDLQYALDPAGQVTNLNYKQPLEPTNLLVQTTTSWTYDAAHQISNAGYGYDLRGRLASVPGRTFQYDAASRLTEINSATLAYNGFNDLLSRTEGGTTTRYFYNHALRMRPIVAEQNEGTSQFLRYYIWTPDGRLLYMIDAANGNAVRHFHFDRVGSTLALTAANGSVTDSYAYTPFGELLGRTGTSQQPFLYVGRYGVRSELNGELYHMRTRYYDPVSARFLTRDPIWPVLSRPESLDPYQYAANNPLMFIDPLGLQSGMRDDLIFQHTDGTLAAWLMDGANLQSGSPISPNGNRDSTWRVVSSGDFNGDRSDLSFQYTDGTVAAWYMDGANLQSGSLISPNGNRDSTWRVVSGVFNGDRNSDLIFQHTDGTVAAWYMDGVKLQSGSLVAPNDKSGNWFTPAGAGKLTKPEELLEDIWKN